MNVGGDARGGISRSWGTSLHGRTVVLLIARAAGPAVTVAMLAVLARRQGADDVGLYGLAAAVFSLAEAAASCGMRHLLPRELARGVDRAILGSATALCALMGFILAGGLAAVAGGLMEGRERIVMLLVAAALPPAALAVSEEGYWLGVQRVGRLALALLSEQAVRLVAGLILLRAGGGAAELVALMGAGRLIAVLLAVPPGGFGWRAADGQSMRALIHQLPVFAGLEAVFQLYWRVDVLILSALAPLRELGYYVAAYRVFSALLLLPQSYGQVLLPGMAASGGDSLFRRALLDTALIGIVLGGGLLMLADPLMALLYGPGFERAASVLAILSVGMVLASLDQAQGRALVARGRQSLDLGALGLATLVNVGLNFCLIPRFGALGAAVATVVSLLVSVGGHAVALRGLRCASS